MKRSKFFFAIGAFALAVVGVFAVKANKKFSGATAIFTAAGTQLMVASSASAHLTTTPVTNQLAYFSYGTNSKATIFNGTGLGARPLYYH